MVIQRIQTLWLLISMVLVIVAALRPFAWLGDQPLFVNDYPVLAVLTWLIACLLFISIFCFKNLRLQKNISLLSLFLMVILAVVGFIYQARLMPEAVPEWGGGVLFLIIAAIFDVMAYRGMNRDQKKLRNSDRLWS